MLWPGGRWWAIVRCCNLTGPSGSCFGRCRSSVIETCSSPCCFCWGQLLVTDKADKEVLGAYQRRFRLLSWNSCPNNTPCLASSFNNLDCIVASRSAPRPSRGIFNCYRYGEAGYFGKDCPTATGPTKGFNPTCYGCGERACLS